MKQILKDIFYPKRSIFLGILLIIIFYFSNSIVRSQWRPVQNLYSILEPILNVIYLSSEYINDSIKHYTSSDFVSYVVLFIVFLYWYLLLAVVISLFKDKGKHFKYSLFIILILIMIGPVPYFYKQYQHQEEQKQYQEEVKQHQKIEEIINTAQKTGNYELCNQVGNSKDYCIARTELEQSLPVAYNCSNGCNEPQCLLVTPFCDGLGVCPQGWCEVDQLWLCRASGGKMKTTDKFNDEALRLNNRVNCDCPVGSKYMYGYGCTSCSGFKYQETQKYCEGIYRDFIKSK